MKSWRDFLTLLQQNCSMSNGIIGEGSFPFIYDVHYPPLKIQTPPFCLSHPLCKRYQFVDNFCVLADHWRYIHQWPTRLAAKGKTRYLFLAKALIPIPLFLSAHQVSWNHIGDFLWVLNKYIRYLGSVLLAGSQVKNYNHPQSCCWAHSSLILH